MAERREPVDLQGLAVSNMLSIEALVKVLLEKKLVSQDELLGAVASVRKEMVGKGWSEDVE